MIEILGLALAWVLFAMAVQWVFDRRRAGSVRQVRAMAPEQLRELRERRSVHPPWMQHLRVTPEGEISLAPAHRIPEDRGCFMLFLVLIGIHLIPVVILAFLMNMWVSLLIFGLLTMGFISWYARRPRPAQQLQVIIQDHPLSPGQTTRIRIRWAGRDPGVRCYAALVERFEVQERRGLAYRYTDERLRHVNLDLTAPLASAGLWPLWETMLTIPADADPSFERHDYRWQWAIAVVVALPGRRSSESLFPFRVRSQEPASVASATSPSLPKVS